VPKRKTEIEAAPARQPAQAPKPFVGQERIVDYFRQLGPEGLAQAYVFSGPRGTGKRSFARALALTLHCERPTSFPLGYCGTCGPCVRGIAGSSGDTIVVDAEFIHRADAQADTTPRKTDDMGIEAARAVLREMQLRSYEGGRMVCIIPDFENVTGDVVYNALLKELEEPDAGKLFLITVERPESVLPTVRSRSVELRFAPLAESAIAGQLETHYGVKKARARTLARRAQGSLGTALEELDDEVAALRASARAWALDCLRSPQEMPATPQLSKEDREAARADLDEIIRQARIAVRDVIAYSAAGDAYVLDVELLPEVKRTAAALKDAATALSAAALAALDEASRLASTNVAPGQILGWLQIQLRSLRV